MTGGRSPLLFAALLAGLWLRLLVPAGWMPAEGPLLTLCGTGGWAVAAIPEGGTPAPDTDPTCGFAALSDVLLGAATLLLPALLLAFALPMFRQTPAPLLRRRAPCPPGRGPPHP